MNSDAVVAVYAQDRKRHDRGDVVQRGEHPFAGLVAHAAVLGPAGGDIGDGQRASVLTGGVAAVVADQVDLDEPGHRVVPVRPGADRDLALEQRPRLGVRAALERMLATFARPGGGRWWPPTSTTSSAAVSSSMSSSPNRRSTATSSPSIGASRFPGRHAQHRPAESQRRNHFRAVLRRARPPWADHLRPQRRLKRLAGVIAVPASGRAQLVEDPALAGLVRHASSGSRSSSSRPCARPSSIPSSGPTGAAPAIAA